MRGHIANANIGISEVGTQLLGLHSLSSGEAATESKVNVAVAAISALLAYDDESYDLLKIFLRLLQNIFAKS